MNFENSKVKLIGNTKYNLDHMNEDMIKVEQSIPVTNQMIANTPQPIYLDYQMYQQCMVPNPQDYQLPDPKARSIFESNIFEFWAPVTDKVVPGIIPGRYWVSTWGRSWNYDKQRPFGLSVHGKGYYQMQFRAVDPNGKSTSFTRKYHRVIMLTFAYFPGCENYEVNHRDSIRYDCRIHNLEWMTKSENTIYGINHGYKKVFGNDYSANITAEDVKRIIDLCNTGMADYNILKELDLVGKVSTTTIRLIRSGKIRTNASGIVL